MSDPKAFPFTPQALELERLLHIFNGFGFLQPGRMYNAHAVMVFIFPTSHFGLESSLFL
jgi:hypothetical protein